VKKFIKIGLGTVIIIILAIAAVGMYKFNYLASQPGYDVDGNKIQLSAEYTVCDENLNRYPNEQAALDAGFDHSQFGAIYCPE
jgi:hypothetical protein